MTTSGSKWLTNADDLLKIFRNALIALVPHMTAAHIPWQEGESYDEWDEIAASLFKGIVVSSVRFANEFSEESELPKYDLLYENVKGFVLIGLKVTDSADNTWIFHRFESTKEPFDTVACYLVDSERNIIPDQAYTCPFEDAKFFFLNADAKTIEKISVPA